MRRNFDLIQGTPYSTMIDQCYSQVFVWWKLQMTEAISVLLDMKQRKEVLDIFVRSKEYFRDFIAVSLTNFSTDAESVLSIFFSVRNFVRDMLHIS